MNEPKVSGLLTDHGPYSLPQPLHDFNLRLFAEHLSKASEMPPVSLRYTMDAPREPISTLGANIAAKYPGDEG